MSKTLRAWCPSCRRQTVHDRLSRSETQVVGGEAKAVKGTCVECGEVERYAVSLATYSQLVEAA